MAKCLINGTNDNSTNGRAIQILNFFVSKGLTPKQACAICGNAYVESGRKYDPKSLNKNDCNESKTKCGPSYGLFQWHDICTKKKPDGSWDESSCSGRFTNLKNYCRSHNLDYTTINGQLEFLWNEGDGYGNKVRAFKDKTSDSMDSLVSWWEKNWEGCGTCNHKERVKEANKLAGLYNQMNKDECNVDTSGGRDGSGSGSSSGTYTCNESEELESSVNVAEESTSEVSSSSSDGSKSENGNANTNTVDKRILFVGDKTARDLFSGSYEITKNCNLQTTGSPNVAFSSFSNSVKSIMSNKNFKPKKAVFYVGASTDWGTVDNLKREIEKICISLSGYDVTFFCPVSASQNAYTSECKLNVFYRTMKKIVAETPKLGGVKALHTFADEMTQNLVLNNVNKYRVHSGNKWVFTQSFAKYFSGRIWSLIK